MLDLLALATTLVAPQGGQALARQLLQRMEAERLRPPLYRMVTLVTAPDGVIVSCEPGEGKGDTDSLAKVCRIASSLRYGAPASVDGQPAYGRTRTIITMYDGVSTKPRVALAPELEIGVEHLPAGAVGKLDLGVTVLVSALGRVERCEPAAEGFSKAACRQLSATVLPIAMTPERVPVPYVQTIIVRFVAAAKTTSGVPK